MASVAPTQRTPGLRRFRITVRTCRGCGHEWPAYERSCRNCAASLGDARLLSCVRLVPPQRSELMGAALAVVIAIELSWRDPTGTREPPGQAWANVAARLTGASRVRPGPAGSIVAAWPLAYPEALTDVAAVAVQLREELARSNCRGLDVRGAIALGVIDGHGPTDAVERVAERLALSAAPGQWLVSEEAARRLRDRFELRPAGMIARWPMSVAGVNPALVGRLEPPVLPSAVYGEPPALMLGRDEQQRRLHVELTTAVGGHRRVVLVTAPAGGGKSYLLRRVLADHTIELAAGVAFPPLGSRALDPPRALLAALADDDPADARVGVALGDAATRRARREPIAVVVDDVHWAGADAVAALRDAILASAPDVPLAWIVSTRTAALPQLAELVELVDATVSLPPLMAADRSRLLGARLQSVPDAVVRHVGYGPERGNPLYLEHLAAAVQRGCPADRLPRSLHEAILLRLDDLVQRARELTHWTRVTVDAGRQLEALECELGDWLDRLETSDVAELATIGRYLARLRMVDAELVIARALLRMPVAVNRRLLHALERLSAASVDATLDYVDEAMRTGRAAQAAYQADRAAARAEQALRLHDAERLLAFAFRHDPSPERARRHGDVALARGRPADALSAYHEAGDGGTGELVRRIARARAALGEVAQAIELLEGVVREDGASATCHAAAMLDLVRLRGTPAPVSWQTLAGCPLLRRRALRVTAWARMGDPQSALDAARALVLTGAPEACAAELIETAALCRRAEVAVEGLDEDAGRAADALGNPRADTLLDTSDIGAARSAFLHWDA